MTRSPQVSGGSRVGGCKPEWVGATTESCASFDSPRSRFRRGAQSDWPSGRWTGAFPSSVPGLAGPSASYRLEPLVTEAWTGSSSPRRKKNRVRGGDACLRRRTAGPSSPGLRHDGRALPPARATQTDLQTGPLAELIDDRVRDPPPLACLPEPTQLAGGVAAHRAPESGT